MEVLVVPAEAERPDGQEVVRKTASLPGERERLLREAEVLQAASRRGVPGLAALVTPPSPEVAEPCMVTSAVAGPSLALVGPLPAVEVAGVAAQVARLLSGLHEAGLVHGAVEPSHVVLDGAGGAILVGLGDGGPSGAPSLDPAVGLLDPADDVAAWGLLVGHLLDWSAAGDDEPLVALRQALTTRRARRGGRQLPRARPDGDERRVLAALADQAQDPDPARRPSARSLAAAVTHRIPAARVPGAVALGTFGSAPGPRLGAGLLERLSAHSTVLAPHPAPPDGDVPDRPAGPPRDRDPEPTAARRRRSGASRRVRQDAASLLLPAAAAVASPAAAPTHAGTAGSPRPPEERPDRPDDAPPRRPRTARPEQWPCCPDSAEARPCQATGSWRRRAGAAAAAIGSTPSGWRWARAAAVAAVGVVVAPAAVAALRTPPRPDALAAPAAAPATCLPVPPPAADVDGDGCEEPVRWVDGVLEAGPARFALGAPGDAWALGDWDCDGRRTPALLHGGALDVFDAWPGPTHELQGRTVASVPGATGVVALAGPHGCELPSISRQGAPNFVVDARRGP